jgi:hypothetical protein
VRVLLAGKAVAITNSLLSSPHSTVKVETFPPSTMTQTTSIFLISLLSSFFTHGTSMLNLTLPGQHPDPESVALEVHR